jgi:hypothetical protein
MEANRDKYQPIVMGELTYTSDFASQRIDDCRREVKSLPIGQAIWVRVVTSQSQETV